MEQVLRWRLGWGLKEMSVKMRTQWDGWHNGN